MDDDKPKASETAICFCGREIYWNPPDAAWVHVHRGIKRCYPKSRDKSECQLRARPDNTKEQE
jgi:hypothetical protein